MRIGKRFLMIGLLALLAFHAVFVIGNYFRSAMNTTPFGWQDEGYVLGPALQVYEKGWESYRCRGNQVVCYGAVHTFFDVLFLKALPDRWLRDSPVMRQPGPEWFYQARYPNAFVALRVFRVAIAVILLGILGWIGGRAFQSVPLGLAWGLALPTFHAFQLSRMGLKNDFSFALYLVVFLLLANEALRAPFTRRTRSFFYAATAVGVVGISVKFGIILPLGILAPTYLLVSIKAGVPRRTILADFAISGVLAAAAFFLTNPSFGVSLGEANWLSSFIAATGRAPTTQERETEFFRVLIPNLWPCLFCVPGVFILMKRGSKAELLRWAYLFGVPVLWALLTWKSAYHRPAYYLPILTWLFVVGAWLPRMPWAVMVILGGFTFYQGGTVVLQERAAWASFSERSSTGGDQEPWKIFDCAESACQERWVVDRTVRAAIPDKVKKSNLLIFDSLVDSPVELTRKIARKWPDSRDVSLRVLVTCWSSPPAGSGEPVEFYSPAAEAWGARLRDTCLKKHPLHANAAFAFENGWRPSEFRILEYSELLTAQYRAMKTLDELRIVRDGISPRMFEGSWQGIDSWYSPVILDRDAILEGVFVFPNGISEATLPFGSTCKGEGSVTLVIGDAKGTRPADTGSELCSRRPWICRIRLENWWTERIGADPIVLRPGIRPGGRARIKIQVTGGNPDRCRISLGSLRFKPAASL